MSIVPSRGASFRNGQYRISTARWPDHFVYMQDGMRGYVSVWNGDAGPQGWWQFINHPTMPGYFMLSTSKWPQCFVFMENGLVGACRGWNHCDPGNQGYWKFVPHIGEDGKEDGYYMITPQKPGWEDKWFVYVESGFSGSLSSWSGDPGPQGWFKVEPWNINIQGAMDQISATMKELPAMPMLGSSASGYRGPSAAITAGQPQCVSEIRLEATYSECVDIHSLSPAQRSMVFHVDQNTVFSQKIGRQHQEAFFSQLVPQRDMLASLSRTVFDLHLEPPSSSPTLTKVSQNLVQVGGHTLRQGEKAQVSAGTEIRLGAGEGQQPFLSFTVHCTRSNSSSGIGVDATCAALPKARGSNGSMFGFMDPAPSPAAAPSGYNHVETRIPQYDSRPGTMPQHPQDCHSADGGMAKAVLECVFSSGSSDLSRQNAVIALVADQEVAVGRLHQLGFFEKLLPDHDQLACISRKHLTARLHRSGHLVEIENVSRNTVTIDSRPLGQGQRGELREGSTLRFTALERTLLEFRLKSENKVGLPGTRFPGF